MKRLDGFFRDMPPRKRFRARLRVSAIGFAGAFVWLTSVLVQEKQYVLALIPTAAVIAVSVFEFALADLVVDSRLPPTSSDFLDRLLQKLRGGHLNAEILRELRACSDDFQGCDPSRVSSTVHLLISVIDPTTDEYKPGLIQVSDYTTAGLGGQRWRIFDVSKGILGRCIRVREKVWVNFRTATEYRTRMVSEFGYTAPEADGHTTSARSYLAQPLVDRDRVIGAIYFISTEPQVFPRAAPEDRLIETAESIVGILKVSDLMELYDLVRAQL